MTRTESFHYDKHKLFLYKEDFEKFADGLTESINFIKNEKGEDYGASNHYEAPVAPVETPAVEAPVSEDPTTTDNSSNGEYKSDISFDDLEADDKG